jgi:hypothetical protein
MLLGLRGVTYSFVGFISKNSLFFLFLLHRFVFSPLSDTLGSPALMSQETDGGGEWEEGFRTVINLTVTLVCFSKQPAWGRCLLQRTGTTEACRDRTTGLNEDGAAVSYKLNGIRDNNLTIGTFDKHHSLQKCTHTHTHYSHLPVKIAVLEKQVSRRYKHLSFVFFGRIRRRQCVLCSYAQNNLLILIKF